MNNIRLMKSPVSAFSKLKTQEKYNGYKWIFHLTDKDTKFPSVLHAHSAEKSLKLDGFTGEIYDIKTKKKIDKLDHDTLNRLHKNDEFQDFARRRINWYNQNHPISPISMPEWVSNIYVKRTTNTAKKSKLLLIHSKKIIQAIILNYNKEDDIYDK